MGQRIKAKKNGFSSPIGAFIFLIVYDKMFIDYERGFSSPIGAFIFLIKSNEIFSYYDSNKFSSPIGAFIFLINCIDNFMKWCEEFSSPIGAFIFLIKDLCYVEYSGNQVFVPYRGFYFLNPGLTILVFMRVKKMFCGVNLF